MQDHFKKLFHLQGVTVTRTELAGKHLIIHCKPRQKGYPCRTCGTRAKTVHRYLPPQEIKHMFWEGNLVKLSLSKRVFGCWWCKKAGKSWITSEQIPLVVKNRSYSAAYADQIIKGLGSTSFKTQQELAETSFQTIQKLLSERIDPLIGVWPEGETVQAIGIDGHSFSGRTMLPTITDITNHRLITILPNDGRTTVRQFLRNIPEKKKQEIAEVCIDMDTAYLKTIKEELPNARIVVDFFHVVADANRRVNEQRILIHKAHKVTLPKRPFEKKKEHLAPNEWVTINETRKAYPELGELWRIKEQIRSIHKTPSSPLAKILYDTLIREMNISPYPSVRAWAKTLARWERYILQYFEHHTTNGYTEGVNTKLKTIKRLSYGFRNINNYIRKSLLCFIPLSLLLTHLLT